MQKSLDQVEDRYRNLIHASTNHMFMLTLDGYYMLSNDKVHQFGLDKGSQLVGRHVLEVHDLETGRFYQKKIEEVVRTKQPVSFEHTLHTTDRKHYHMDTLYPMHKNGEVWAIGGICRDITDSKESEIELRESKERYKDLVEKAGTAILVDDAEGNFEYFNKQFAELFGYTNQELKNKSLSSLIHPDDLGQVKKMHNDRMQGKEVPTRYEYKGIKKDGSIIYIEVDAVELREDDQVVGTRSYLWDITDRKKAELQLRQTMKYLSELEENFRQQAAQKLHDHVGQNLTALTFNLDYIYNQLPKISNKNIKKRFDDSLNLLNDTIQSIRNIISEMRPSVLEDYGLFAAIKWYAEKYSERTGIQTRIKGSEIEKRLPKEIESSIFRIIQELFNNAAKYSKADKIMVNFQEEDDKINIEVRDDGIGFKIDDIKDSDGPTGMGILSMEDRVVALGGEFELKTAPGQGTKIKIILEK
jgi:PAS domain S-box-containing protein